MSETTTDRWPALMKKTTAAAYVDRTPRWIEQQIAAERFPRPVRAYAGADPQFRKADLDNWLESLSVNGE